jgi:cytochrome bd ubiquinol oxidase subunit I
MIAAKLADMDDALLLSRIQFAFVISFHILFPAFTIGLASWLAYLEGMYLWKKDVAYRELYFFWLKIFAVSFGMGVVSGIVMSFQFGTNWSRFSEATGNILGPLLSYEVLTAFFLEAGFLGVMLFGWRRVSPRVHFFCTAMVALGTLISTFWITSANSWMHTPAGFELRAGVFHPVDWWAVVFNPSFPWRLVHMALAAFLTTAFVIGGVAAAYLLRGRFVPEATRMMRLSVLFVAIVVPLQIFAGDQQGLVVAEHQPAKLAAMEGHWRDEGAVPLLLFAWPDGENERNDYELGIPNLGSVILTHSWEGRVRGLAEFPRADRPPVLPVFWCFRIMVAIGVAMLALAIAGVVLLRRGRFVHSRWYLLAWKAMLPSGFVAVLAGWFTAEIGRQPWVVYGLMRTADAHSGIGAGSVLASLVAFAIVYAVVFGAGLWFIVQIVKKGPAAVELPETEGGEKTAKRPLSVPEPVEAPRA